MSHLQLGRRLLQLLFCTILMTALCIAGLLAYRQADAPREALIERHLALARLSASQAAYQLEPENERDLRRVLEGLSVQDSVVYVALLNRKGQVLLEKGKPQVPGPAGSEQIPKPLVEETRAFADDSGQHYYQLTVAVLRPVPGGSHAMEGDGALAFLRVLIVEDGDLDQSLILIGQALLIGLTVGLLVFGLAVSVLQRLLKPFTDLVNTFRDSSNPKPEIGLVLERSPDTRCLAEAFSSLQVRLKESRREVVTFQLDFEDRVKARTLELHHAQQRAQRASNQSRAHVAFLMHLCKQMARPLSGTLNLANQLLSSELKASQRGFVEAIIRAIQSLQWINSELALHARSDAPQEEQAAVDIDLVLVLSEVYEQLSEEVRDKDVSLSKSIDPELPSKLCGDPGLLRLVLITLIGVVFKHSQTREVITWVRVEHLDELSCQLFVQIANHRDNLLPFKSSRCQALRATLQPSDYLGTGLCLMTCHHFVSLMGGELGAYSQTEPDGFWFSARFEVRRSEPQFKPEYLARLQGLHCLIVDSQEADQVLLTTHLTSFGMTYEIASDGASAIRLIKDANARGCGFDAAILELIMTGMDGIELARAIAELSLPKKLRILVLSAPNQHINTQKARLLGIGAIVPKPLRQGKLLENLFRLLELPHDLEQPDFRPHPFPVGPIQFDARILVAEDNAINQAVAESLLEHLGCRVILAKTGREAVSFFAEEACDLILMDIQMPEMDGVEAMRLIRIADRQASPPRRTPIVAVTAHAVAGDRESYLRMGMDDYLSKPFDQEQLIGLLSRWLVAKGQAHRRVTPSIAAAKPSTGVLDGGHLQKMRAMETQHAQSIIEKLIAMFEEDTPRTLHALHEAVAYRDFGAAGRALHSLKSSSGNLGARALAELCAQMEHYARANEINKLSESLIDLQFEYEQVRRALLQLKTLQDEEPSA